MTSSPREHLAQALDTIGDYAQLADKAGVTPRDFLNAQSGRPCATVPFLRICVAVRHDPLPSIPHTMPEKPSDFDFGFFSMAFRMKRAMLDMTEVQAGRAVCVSPVTIRRIEAAYVIPIGVILRACCFIQIHPFGYLAVTDTPCRRPGGNVSRETSPVAHVLRESLTGIR
jgi:hypothetical protein